MDSEVRRHLLEILQAALAAVHGRVRVQAYLRAHPLSVPAYVIAVGKAACAMTQGARETLGEEGIRDALIVTRRGYAEPLPWPVIEAGHPLPDEASLEAGGRLKAFIQTMPREAGVIVLLSGGASTLLELPAAGIELGLLRQVNAWLLGAGLDIRAVNAVRSRLSQIKGGRLAPLLYPRRVLALAISDVPGNDPRVIGSGPLLPAEDSGSVLEAVELPGFVRAALARRAPPPAPEDACFRNVTFKIIATNEDARRAAAEAALGLGYRAVVAPESLTGDAVEAGRRLAGVLREAPPGIVHVWGGETTVRLPPQPGRGGRCQSLALSAAMLLKGHAGVYLLAVGTDGTDGPTEDAGALVDGGTVTRGEGLGLDARQALEAADAGSFLAASGDLVHTGATGTNVMDIVIGLRKVS